MTRLLPTAVLVVALGSLVVSAHAADDAPATAVVRSFHDGLRDAWRVYLGPGEDPRPHVPADEVLVAHYDVLAMLERSLPASIWSSLGQRGAERKAYQTAFRSFLAREHLPDLGRFLANKVASIEYLGAEVFGKRRQVVTRFATVDREGKVRRARITYVLHPVGQQSWRIVDVVVDGRSVVRDLRMRFVGWAQGPESVLDHMKGSVGTSRPAATASRSTGPTIHWYAPNKKAIVFDQATYELFRGADAVAILATIKTQTAIHHPKGHVAGLRITGFQKDAPKDVFQVRRGDIVKSINGRPVRSRDDVLRIVQGLTDQYIVTVVIDRRGKDITYKFDPRDPRTRTQVQYFEGTREGEGER